MDYLPKFVVQDILLRLPTKSVLQARCVSRFLRNTIDDWRFRLLLKPEVPVILGCEPMGEAIFNITVNGTEGVILEKKMASFPELRGSSYFPRNCCNGLIYARNCDDDNGVDGAVLDPFSGKVVKVREQSKHSFYDERALGFDASTGTYKLVRVLAGKCISAAVYSFRTERWAPCEAPPLMIGDRGVYLSRSGSLNWLASKAVFVINNLISFDLRNEKFSLIQLPLPKNRANFPSVHIFECDDRLGLCGGPTAAGLCVWILDDFEGQRWSKRYCISMPISTTLLGKPCHVLGVHSDKKILIAAGQTLFSYDLEDNEVMTLGVAEFIGAIPLYCMNPNVVPLSL